MSHPLEPLLAELASAEAALAAHRASWAYAYAMGAAREGGRRHPVHLRTEARTAELARRCLDLRARIAEHEP